MTLRERERLGDDVLDENNIEEMMINLGLTCMDRSSQLRLQNVRMEYQWPCDEHVRNCDLPSFDSAPKKKKSQSVNTFPFPPAPLAFLRLTTAFFNCSNTVY